MTRSADTQISLDFSSTIKNTLDDGHIASLKVGQRILQSRLTNGIGARQTNRAWEEQGITITSGNTLDLDLYDYAGRDIGAGAGRDALGQVLTIEEIVCLVIHKTAGAGSLEIMPTVPTNGVTWIPAQTVANGGALKTNGIRMFYQEDEDAFDIEDASSHMLRLGANGGAVTFSIFVAGRHDDNESSSSSLSSSSQSSSSSSNSSSSSSSSSSQSTSSQSTSSTAALSTSTTS